MTHLLFQGNNPCDKGKWKKTSEHPDSLGWHAKSTIIWPLPAQQASFPPAAPCTLPSRNAQLPTVYPHLCYPHPGVFTFLIYTWSFSQPGMLSPALSTSYLLKCNSKNKLQEALFNGCCFASPFLHLRQFSYLCASSAPPHVSAVTSILLSAFPLFMYCLLYYCKLSSVGTVVYSSVSARCLTDHVVDI